MFHPSQPLYGARHIYSWVSLQVCNVQGSMSLVDGESLLGWVVCITLERIPRWLVAVSPVRGIPRLTQALRVRDSHVRSRAFSPARQGVFPFSMPA